MPEFREIPVALCDPPEIVSRGSMDEGAMRELCDSIRRLGLIQPISVVQHAERFRITAGHRRWTAHRTMNLEMIRAVVYQAGEIDVEAAELDENIVREDLNPADEALFVYRVGERVKWDVERLCKIFHRSEKWIGDRYDLLNGCDLVFRALQNGEIGLGVARELNRIKQKELRSYYLDQARRRGVSLSQVQEWVHIALTLSHAQPVEEIPVVPVDLPPAPEVKGPECVFCGGKKDPWNMEMVWLHKWHIKEHASALQELQAKRLGE